MSTSVIFFFLFQEMSPHDLKDFHYYRSEGVQVLLNTPTCLPVLFKKYQCVFIINLLAVRFGNFNML